MRSTHAHPTSWLTAAVLALLLALVPATAALAQDRTAVDMDLTGAAAVATETSILWSQQTFASADEVIIATAADGADALASGVLQSGAGGALATTVDGEEVSARPLFLVDPTSALEPALLAEIQRLGASDAILLGGEAAIPNEIADALPVATDVEVTRLGGATRIATAVMISEMVYATDTADRVFLSRAFGTDTDSDTAFADSSALGGWAAATGDPILLTDTDQLALETQLHFEELLLADISAVTIVGGTAAVSDAVADAVVAMGFDVTRVAGDTRERTAVAIADARGLTAPGQLILTEGWDEDFFTSSFTAAAASALWDAPIVLSNHALTADPTTFDFIAAAEPTLTTAGDALHCTPAVDDAICGSAADLIGAASAKVTMEPSDPTGLGDILDGGGDGPVDLPDPIGDVSG